MVSDGARCLPEREARRALDRCGWRAFDGRMPDSTWDDPNAPWHSRDNPPEGYTRVWFNNEDFLDYSPEDFDAAYVDNNTTGFRIQPDPWRLEYIDEENITLYYSSGAEFTVKLGAIGTPIGAVEKYRVGDGNLVYPATAALEVNLSEHYVPRLFLLRMAIHEAIRQAIADRLELTAIGAAFGQIIGLNSSGGTPTTAQEINDKIRLATGQ